MERIYKTLREFGLNDNEIKVYIEAIKHERITPYSLSRLVKIPRTTVYEVMTNLSLKGLISIKNSQGLEKQQTWIIAKNPGVLREMIKKRRKDLVRLEVDIVRVLPLLKDDFLINQSNADFQFFPGIDGVKKVFKLIEEIFPSTDIYMFDHLMPVDTLGSKYINELVEKEIKMRNKYKKTKVKAIIPLNDWTKHVLTYQYGRNNEYINYHDFRYIENSLFNLYQDFYIFEDTVAITTAKDDEVWGVVIKSNLLSKSFKSIFNVLWQMASPVTKKFVDSLGKNDFLKQEKKTKSL